MADRKTQKPEQRHDVDATGRSTSRDIDQHGSPESPALRYLARFGQLGGLWDEPVEWALPLPRIFGLRIRLHLFLLAFCLVHISHAIWPPSGHPVGGNWTFTMLALAALLTGLAIHEASHLVVNRLLQGETDEVNLWPLGGLTPAYAPGGWHPNLLVFVAGPLVNLTICLALTPILALWITHDWWAVIFNPLDPASAYARWAFLEDHAWWMLYLWWLNYASFVLFAFNVLPMYPLDGAEILHWSLRTRLHERRATEITTAVGYVIAVTVGLVALVARAELVLAVAVLAGVMTWLKRRRIEFIPYARPPDEREADELSFGLDQEHETDHDLLDIEPDPASPEPTLRLVDDTSAATRPPSTSPLDAGDTALDIEVDRILAKIHREGMANLTNDERTVLDEASRRRKDHGRSDPDAG